MHKIKSREQKPGELGECISSRGHCVRAEWAFIVPGGLGRSLLEEEEEGEWGGQQEFDYSRR